MSRAAFQTVMTGRNVTTRSVVLSLLVLLGSGGELLAQAEHELKGEDLVRSRGEMHGDDVPVPAKPVPAVHSMGAQCVGSWQLAQAS